MITEASLSGITARQRAMLKLQLGCLPLSPDELRWVLAEKQAEAIEVKTRTLREVAALFGVSKERIRQINTRSMEKLGLATAENAA